MSSIGPHRIAAVSVNHNTSQYMELMVRSLFSCHATGLDFSLTIFDNDSTDDMQELHRCAEQFGVPSIPGDGAAFLLRFLRVGHGGNPP